MPQQVIDLKKRAPAPYSETPPSQPSPQNANAGEKDNAILLEWSSYEYQKKERGPYGILWLGAAATILIILGILAKSYFFVALVVLSFAVLVMYVKKEPREFTFAITKTGIRVENLEYMFTNLKSFWIFDKPDGKELSLETQKGLMPFLRIPLAGIDPAKIRSLLRDILPEEEHQEFFSDRIANRI